MTFALRVFCFAWGAALFGLAAQVLWTYFRNPHPNGPLPQHIALMVCSYLILVVTGLWATVERIRHDLPFAPLATPSLLAAFMFGTAGLLRMMVVQRRR